MARRIHKSYLSPVVLDLVRADGLRDASRLARGDVRLPDIIKQGGLAVVNVPQYHHDRRPGKQSFRIGVLHRSYKVAEKVDKNKIFRYS